MTYQDYVIKDGKFIGDFERMYQDYDDPWHQIGMAESSYSRNDTAFTINKLGIKNVIEVGCGLGNTTNLLSHFCKNSTFTGIDISKTAIRKAREKYPDIHFEVGGGN